ncbi:hypothetical protein JCM19238_4956 [Vibrio ponticus]|nr:hypothetical protein JCM19238_4956 [Vibrio ponticus]
MLHALQGWALNLSPQANILALILAEYISKLLSDSRSVVIAQNETKQNDG